VQSTFVQKSTPKMLMKLTPESLDTITEYCADKELSKVDRTVIPIPKSKRKDEFLVKMKHNHV